jgi:hypothetical protein
MAVRSSLVCIATTHHGIRLSAIIFIDCRV